VKRDGVLFAVEENGEHWKLESANVEKTLDASR
jgi:hypothetical protein